MLKSQALERHGLCYPDRDGGRHCSRFRDVEAGGLETPAQGPRMGEAGFGLVSVTPKPPLWALMFPAFY